MTITASPQGLAEAVIEPLRHIAIIGPNAIVLNRHVNRDRPTGGTPHPETGISEASYGGVANDISPLHELLPNEHGRLARGQTACQDGDISLMTPRSQTELHAHLIPNGHSCGVLSQHLLGA
jgi:hypothetical protein